MTSNDKYLTAGRLITSESGLHQLVGAERVIERRSIKALVADDDIFTHDLYEAALNKYGIRDIEFTENGQEAINAVKERRPDIVFLDTNMPMMEGYEACRLLRATYGTDLRIVGMSSIPPNKRLWEEVGADHYFDKDVLCGISHKENLGTHLTRMFPQYFNK